MSDMGSRPAFPRLGLKVTLPDGSVVPNEPGISTRTYLAAKAMQGMLAARKDGANEYELRWISRQAYAMADAMLDREN
jgi:hypothetical protein